MSKSFTREADFAPEPVIKPNRSVLPPGARNYITSRGVKILRQHFLELFLLPLTSQVRQRLCDLENSLQFVEVVEPPPPPWLQVQFGATVTVRTQQDEEIEYTIVGVDETDLDRNQIGWPSPVAQALLKRSVGEYARFRTPDGEQLWEITKVVYDNAN